MLGCRCRTRPISVLLEVVLALLAPAQAQTDYGCTYAFPCRGEDDLCYPHRCRRVSDGEVVCSVDPCIACSDGEYYSGAACHDCSPGKYRSRYSDNHDSCDDCSSGQYQSSTGSSSCDRCPRGQYQSSTGSSSCLDCPSGKTSSSGADSSSDCYSTASDYDVTDCSIKLWKAEWLDTMLSLPQKMSSDIYSMDPDLESPDCQDSLGNAYDTYFPSWARIAVSNVYSSDIPNGDEVCHLICERGCGTQWMDPSGYFIAVEIDCSLSVSVNLLLGIGALIIAAVICICISRCQRKSSATVQPTIVVQQQQQYAPQPMVVQRYAPQPTVVVAERMAPVDHLDEQRKMEQRTIAASMCLTEQQLGQFRSAFARFDVDDSGSIDARQLGDVMQLVGEKRTAEELAALAQQMGSGQSGKIDFVGFISIMSHRAKLRAELVKLTVGALRERAVANGCRAIEIDEARDAKDPQAELIELILERMAQPRYRAL